MARQPTIVFVVDEHHPRCRLGEHTGPCRTVPVTVPELHGGDQPEFAPGWSPVPAAPVPATREAVRLELERIGVAWAARPVGYSRSGPLYAERRAAVMAARALQPPIVNREIGALLGVTGAMVGLIQRSQRQDTRPVITV